MASIDAFLNSLGGDVAVAEALEIERSAVGNWKTRGAIPWSRYPDLLALAKAAKPKPVRVPRELFGTSSSNGRAS